MFAQPCTVRTAAMEVDFPGGWKDPFLFCGEQALQLFGKLPGYQLFQGFNPAIAQRRNLFPGFFIQRINGDLNGVGFRSAALNQRTDLTLIKFQVQDGPFPDIAAPPTDFSEEWDIP